jgi:hypothetical protein
MTCDRCGHDIGIGDYPFCKGNVSDHQGGHYGVIPDDIPGGLVIEHGLCHEDGTPRTYYSKTEINREAKRRGWTPFVRHVGERGSDKSPHTSRWV